MGYESEYSAPIVLDIETVGLDEAKQYVEPVHAPSNYKDAEKIAAYIAEGTAEAISRAALDLDLCRVVAIGIAAPWTDLPYEPYSLMARTVEHERTILETLSSLVSLAGGGVRPIITFNGLWFDLPTVMRRSLYQNIFFPHLNVDRFRSPHIDVMQALSFNDPKKTRSLQFYCKRFDIPVPDPLVADITGADIGRLVAENTEHAWDLVRRHVLADVAQLRDLARRVGIMPRAA